MTMTKTKTRTLQPQPKLRAAACRRFACFWRAVRVALAVWLLATTDGRGNAAAAAAAARSLTRVVHTRYGKMQGIVEASGAAAGAGAGLGLHGNGNANANGHRARAAIEIFLGVPYAMPPTGPNRFSPTRALTPWDGVKVFDQLGAVCPQWLPDTANETEALRQMPKGRLEQLKRLLPYLRNQSEDCLHLNIYAPAAGDDSRGTGRKYPVLVYFHGESYSWNSGNPYDGRTLAGYADSIVVTFNYRLGVLGFLNVNSEPLQKARVANYGLMDQIAALHWIQQNIGNFHGDPSNVTLVGHGTGAACVNFLMISPAVMPGLFRRTILLSGSALSSWALVEEPTLYSLEIARQTNCSRHGEQDEAKNSDRMVDCLRRVPLARLAATRVTAPTFLHAFGPSVDGVVIRADFRRRMFADTLPQLQTSAKAPPKPLLSAAAAAAATTTTNTTILYRNSKLRQTTAKTTAAALDTYDLLFGCVTGEALHGFSHEDVESGFEGERRDRILRTYIRNTYEYHLSEIFYTVVNEYTDWERTVAHPINTRDSTVAALSDAQFVAPLVQTGDSFSRPVAPSRAGNVVSPPPVKAFFYVFDYQTKDGDYPQRSGAVHGEDLPYIFGAPLADSPAHFARNFTKQEAALSEALMIYIGNFARVGNPNEYQKQEPAFSIGKERNRFKETVWEEYDAIHQKYMEISTKPKMKNHFRAHQLSVWLRLIPELHRAGMEDVSLRHNLFHSHESGSGLYEGVVRADKNQGAAAAAAVHSQTSRRSYSYSTTSTRNTAVAEIIRSMTTLEPLLTTCVSLPTTTNSTAAVRSNSNRTSAETEAEAAAAAANAGGVLSSAVLPSPSMGRGPYTTSLAVTIAIGCTLFLLNALIYALVRYQGDKTRSQFKGLREQQIQHQQQQQQQQQQERERSHTRQPKQRELEYADTTFKLPPSSPLSCENGVGFAAFGHHSSSSWAFDSNRNSTFAVSDRAKTALSQVPPFGHQPQLAYDDSGNGDAVRTCTIGDNGGHHHHHHHHHQRALRLRDNDHQQRRHCHPQPPLRVKYAEKASSGCPATHQRVSTVAVATTMTAAVATNASVSGRPCAAAESQPLLHQAVLGGSDNSGPHSSGSTQSLHKGAVLRVPAAAISEMRV